MSVIIPIYNSEQYLEDCIRSIWDQDYKQLQIICVDDGSTDNSGAILKDLSQKDSRLQLLHQANAGVSAARNVGISAATGDFVLFVDSDDRLHPKMISRFVDAMGNDVDLVMSATWKKTSFSREDRNLLIYQGIRDSSLNPPWGKLYRLSKIKMSNIKFPEDITLGEDLIFNMRYLRNINRVAIVSKGGYLPRAAPDSLTRSYRPDKYSELMRSRRHLSQILPNENQVFDFISLFNYILIKSLVSASNNLHAASSPLGVLEKMKTIQRFEAESGKLPVRYGDFQMLLVGWCYNHLGLQVTSWAIRTVKSTRSRRASNT